MGLLSFLSIFIVSVVYGLDEFPEEHFDEEFWRMDFNKLEQNNPILKPIKNTSWICPIRNEEIFWEEKDVFNPAAVVKDGLVYILYRAEDSVGALAGTSRIGLAWSSDGINFQNRLTVPVLYPDKDSNIKYEWEGGCEDPRVVESPEGKYIMTYTSYDGTARLSVATSDDLVLWEKHGPAFGNAYGKSFINAWTKSGSIVVKPQEDGRLIATKINGTYWMYWGENHIYVATSDDLINWTPMLGNDKGFYRGRPDHQDHPVNAMKPKSVLRPRKGKFDSNLVEPGPPAILREDGILFIYNSKNTACPDEEDSVCPKGIADPKLAPGTYSAGQALFSKDDPTVLLARTSDAFFKPSASFEITGQVGNVCFLEGLVYFKRKWLLYYGTADSKIAVAEAVHYGYDSLPRKYKSNPLEEEEEEEGNHSAALEALLAAKKLHSKLRYESESTQTADEKRKENTDLTIGSNNNVENQQNQNNAENNHVNSEASIVTPSTDKEEVDQQQQQQQLEEEKAKEKEIKDELKASETALQREF